MTPTATGHVELRDATTYLVLERTFVAPIESVWAAVTEPERLARWIGTWTGDPASGKVDFRMLFEGEPMTSRPQSEWMRIDACDPPRHLAVTSQMPGEADASATWQMVLDLRRGGGCHHADLRPVAARAGVGRERRARVGLLPRPVGGRRGEARPRDGGLRRDYPALKDSYVELFGRAT